MKTTTLLVGACVLAAASANAVTLFENAVAGFTPTANFVDSTPPPSNTQNHFAVTQVVVPAGGWSIDSITGTMAIGNGFSPGVGPHSAYLHIVPAANLATYDPTAAGLASATMTVTVPGSFFGAGQLEITGNAGGITVAAGTYWLGVTGVFDNPATNGIGNAYGGADVVPSQHYAGTNAFINTSTSPNALNTWEAIDGAADNAPAGIAIRVEGSVVPEPSSLMLLGLSTLGLAVRRRR